jgi:RNA polymerase sigma-70 factor (ECF subfamily)
MEICKPEDSIRQLVQSGRIAEAVEAVLELYGPEIGGWLVGTLGSESEGREAYSLFLEALWKGIATFRWESSLRTWAYRVARNTAWRVARDSRRKPLLSESFAEGIPVAPPSESKPWLRTEVKAGLPDLLSALKAEDRMILILRVDRGMTWEDVSRVIYGEEACRDPRSLIARTAAVRQRFLRVKRRLRRLAKDRGIL